MMHVLMYNVVVKIQNKIKACIDMSVFFFHELDKDFVLKNANEIMSHQVLAESHKHFEVKL